MSFYRQQLEDWLGNLDVKAYRVLDIGGAALPVKDRVKSWKVSKYDIGDNGLEDGKYDVEVDIQKKSYLNTETYNVVFCLEVMEYIYNPVLAVRNIYRFLEDDGVAYITFPFVYPVHHPVDEDCLRYTEAGIVKLLEDAGFKKWTIQYRRALTRTLEQYYKEDGMHPAKGLTHNVTGYIVTAHK